MEQNIPLQRLFHQLLDTKTWYTPQQVVEHLLCMQAQDRNQHLWAIASRAWCSKEDIIKEYNNGTIVRTWTQRGTIHVISSEDVKRMTQLCATKTLSSFTKRKEYLGINDNQYDRALHCVEEYLSSGPKLRKDIWLYLAECWIPITSGLLYNILCFAGSSGLIVQWPIINDEQAFVLTSQRIKQSKQYDEQAFIKQLCLRYFSSHGPATIEDLQRWSGLGKTIIKKGISECGDDLQSFEYEEKTYYNNAFNNSNNTAWYDSIHFLAWFDERLLWYKNRSATVHNDHLNKIDISRNGVFKPTIMINGITIGIWTIKHKSKVTEVTIKPFDTITSSEYHLLEKAITDYAQYIAKPVHLSMI